MEGGKSTTRLTLSCLSRSFCSSSTKRCRYSLRHQRAHGSFRHTQAGG